jgi:uncharacterized protein YjiS (DUF1127 family)
MEQVMYGNDEFYFLRFEHKPLTPEQMDRLQREAARNAKQARARAVRSQLGALVRTLRSAASAGSDRLRSWWTAYEAWRTRRAAVTELAGLDDRTLKDLGLHRSEIESVVYGRSSAGATEERVAAVLFHKPYARRGAQKAAPRDAVAVQDATDRAAAA